LSDDPNKDLLAAIEAMHKDLNDKIQGVRDEMAQEREARAGLASRKLAAAGRQAQYRQRHRDVTADVTVTPRSQVLLDPKQRDQEQEQLPAALRHADVTVVTPLLQPKLTGAIWKSYSEAYFEKYGTYPVRNAKVNGQIAQLAKRLGAEAVEVAAFYVRHRGAFYQQKGHAIGPLLADAEKLRMEWATDRQITGVEARQQEQTQANREGWDRLHRRPKNAVE
jgi:hypothetical protein